MLPEQRPTIRLRPVRPAPPLAEWDADILPTITRVLRAFGDGMSEIPVRSD
jgi:hypothetical protein